MNAKHTQRGQALILIVLGIIGLVAVTALAIDAGNSFSDRRHAQNAADAAALAAALAKINGQDFTTAATNRATSNGYDGVTNNTVTVTNPPAAGCDGSNGPYAGNDEYIQVIIRSDVNTFFAPIIGIDQLHNCVEAIARARPSTTSEMYDGHAVVALAPSGAHTFFAHGGNSTEIEIQGGGIFVNSSDTSGFCINGNLDEFEVEGSVDVVSTEIAGECMPSHGEVEEGYHRVTAVPYPPQYEFPQITCSDDAAQSGSSMTEGNWSGTFPPAGVTTLNSGTYCISGEFRLSGNDDSLTGDGATIVMLSGGITWPGNSTVDLEAPDSGPYADLAIYVPLSNPNTLTMNGNNCAHIEGTILAPSSNISILGNAGECSEPNDGDDDGDDEFEVEGQVIGYTVEIGGSGGVEIEYEDENNYDATVPPTIEIAR